MSLPLAPAGPVRHRVEDPLVLRTVRLRPGVDLQQTSRYSDDVWQLKYAMLREHERSYILNFASLPERFRPTAKRVFYALLTQLPPDGEEPVGMHTIRHYLGPVRMLLAWLEERWPPDRVCLRELSPADLDAYNRHLLVCYPHNPGRRASHRMVIRVLWRWRSRLGDDGLRFDPLRIDGWSQAAVTRRGENATDRLPESVLGPLLVWALRFVDEFSTDILRADRQWRQARLNKVSGDRRAGRIEAGLRRMLDEHLAQNRPLPGYDGQLNIQQFARILDCNRKSVQRYSDMIDEAIAVVGIAPASYFNTEITGRLEGQPWADAIATSQHSDLGLAPLGRHLQTACYIVIAYLSGMRDSELKHLKRGCLQVQSDPDGNPYRWKVRSLAFKGERDQAGVPATWVVGEPVARAIKVLEDLQPSDVDHLFSRLGHGPGAQKETFAALTSGATNEQLQRLVTWINNYCTANERTDTIPEINKTVFRLKTSHFRRTLAWFVARHPGGVIAGALQYRHHSIQMFEGYAGTSASGFRAEVESEQALSRGEFYTHKIEAHEHTDFTGPAAEEASARLQEFGERAQFQGVIALDSNRLRRIMKRHDPAVYPGTYITCVHDPAKALCEKARRGRREGLPEHGGCLPLACRNVALTIENVQAWQREVQRLERRLAARPPLPPLLQHRLNQRRNDILDFLTSNDTPGTTQ